jgi:hypothetical protein
MRYLVIELMKKMPLKLAKGMNLAFNINQIRMKSQKWKKSFNVIIVTNSANPNNNISIINIIAKWSK